MKIFRESILILTLYFIGEFTSSFLNLPIPGNIIGMLLLFVLLLTGIIKLEKIETVSSFLLNHLAFFFIPAGVTLMNSFDSLKGSIIPILLICIITTGIVMVVTSLVVQFVANKINNGKKGA